METKSFRGKSDEDDLLRKASYAQQRGKICFRPPHPLEAQRAAESRARRARRKWRRMHKQVTQQHVNGGIAKIVSSVQSQQLDATSVAITPPAAEDTEEYNGDTENTSLDHPTACGTIYPRAMHSMTAHHTLPSGR